MNHWMLAAVSFLAIGTAARANEWTVGSDVKAANQIGVEAIDHSIWNRLLSKHVDENGRVAYANWKAEGTTELDKYLAELSRADLDRESTLEGKLAYWINAYNAVTVRGILREYPTTSIRNHTARLWGYNIWKQLFLKVDGQKINLDSMEHKILRSLGEPRIHFAIVCASVGCPRLLNEAYMPDRIEEQLTRNTQDFLTRSQNIQVDGDDISLSSIIKWFKDDFGTTDADRLRWLAKYAPAASQRALKSGRARVKYLDYDWSLNEQK